MNMTEICLFDDHSEKYECLQYIVDQGGHPFKIVGVNWSLENRPEKILQGIIDCVIDPNITPLIDLFISDNLDTKGKFRNVHEMFLSWVNQHYTDCKSVENLAKIINAALSGDANGHEDFDLSTLIISTLLLKERQFLMVSSLADSFALGTTFSEEKFPSWFEKKWINQLASSLEKFPSNVNSAKKEPRVGERFMESLTLIREKNEMLPPHLFVEKVVSLNHKDCKSEKAGRLLGNYLSIGVAEFSNFFGKKTGAENAADWTPSNFIVEMLKGMTANKSSFGLHAAWFLCLGVYRNKFPNDRNWTQKWELEKMSNLSQEINNTNMPPFAFIGALGVETVDRLAEEGEVGDLDIFKDDLLAMVEMCSKLFSLKGKNDVSILDSVTIDSDKLIFKISIGYESISKMVRKVFHEAMTQNEQLLKGNNQTSMAILKFVIAQAFNSNMATKEILPSGRRARLILREGSNKMTEFGFEGC